jgi:hypothetical protein
MTPLIASAARRSAQNTATGPVPTPAEPREGTLR